MEMDVYFVEKQIVYFFFKKKQLYRVGLKYQEVNKNLRNGVKRNIAFCTFLQGTRPHKSIL